MILTINTSLGAWVSDGWDDVNLGRTQFEFGTVSLSYISSLQTCTVRFQCECNSSGLRHCHLACDTFGRLGKKSQKLHTMSTLWQSHTVTKMVCEVKGSTSKDWLQIASAIVLLPLADVVAVQWRSKEKSVHQHLMQSTSQWNKSAPLRVAHPDNHM